MVKSDDASHNSIFNPNLVSPLNEKKHPIENAWDKNPRCQSRVDLPTVCWKAQSSGLIELRLVKQIQIQIQGVFFNWYPLKSESMENLG